MAAARAMPAATRRLSAVMGSAGSACSSRSRRVFAAAASSGLGSEARYAFRQPVGHAAMPRVASDDPELMGLGRLLRHMREAAFVWRILHPPFWRQAFGRLRALQAELGAAEAAQVLVIARQLPLVDLDMVAHCESILTGRRLQGTSDAPSPATSASAAAVSIAGSDSPTSARAGVQEGPSEDAGSAEEAAEANAETDAETAAAAALLELKPATLAEAAEALCAMRRTESASAVFRALAGRPRRLEQATVVRLLDAARHAAPSAATDFADAAARDLAARERVPLAILAAAAPALATLAEQKRCPTGPRSGLARLYLVIARRLREGEAISQADAGKVAAAATRTGHSTPGLLKLLEGHGAPVAVATP
eukprot:TRINITY_DN77063_c0_g1_i1.p1 TRINITY_DN77063_c0_g1~~TRINITY_DN77063_c0_g1_i1.p1  ORF type:complete len:366 (-),score=84.84 TRINITY_DN77063_c0_g1_i1:35-1132(-)